MIRAIRSTILVGAVLAAPAFCFAEQIDNPAYKAWAKFKAGSSVTMTSESDVGGTNTQSTVTTTLLSIDSNKATLEIKLAVMIAGEKTQMPAKKMDLAAKVDKPEEPATRENPRDKPKVVTEDVEVAGKTYSCKVAEASSVHNGIPIQVKTWSTEEIPGSVARVQTVVPEGPMKGTTTATATSITIK